MADSKNNIQETMEDDFCLVEDPDDLEGDSDDDGFYVLPILSCKSKAKSTEDYAEAPKYVHRKEVLLEDVLKDHALHLLPAKALFRFKTVSRRWDQWISSPLFAHRQTTYFENISGLFCQVADFNPSFLSFDRESCGMPDPSLKFLPETVSVRTSCKGLLCCQSVGENVYYICNPVTKEWKKLPKPNLYHGAEAAVLLVFEPHLLNFNESYELVCAVTFPHHPVVYFEIYSSRSSSWRVSDTICCEFDSLELHNGGYYMKGVVYWEASSSVILAFDLRNEQYGILPLPANGGHYGNGTLSVYHDELCYILPRYQDNVCTVYIHGNMNLSLKSVINLTYDAGSTFGVCRALGFINNDILILALGTDVISYHVREDKVELISTSVGGAWTTYVPYVNNLVSVRHPLIKDKGLIV
ncbi:Detected protein of confused Function [Hibiscus syriacus]|uniref:Detected protein of confused Function n=1 Tax=Hibiscus syriacus TaxID=106335 RepID=A0A6A2WZI1_HIBSY|nr:F-box protein At5g49610-like [Hibiscus syriacus]KAE8655096.1 Detected protein of confused Function [Hibiscus syriacus]